MMISRRDDAGAALLVLILLVVAFGLCFILIYRSWPTAGSSSEGIQQLVLVYSTLPRLATAIIAGASLSLAGALFQMVLRNPLADPTTLGVSAGANLALVIVSLSVPGLLGYGRDFVALGGSAMAALIVVGLGARRNLSPYAIVLSGLVLSLWCGGLAAILTYLNEFSLASLFIWGAGSLVQQSWTVPLSLFWKLGSAMIACLLLLRPLAVMELGDGGSAALGIKPAYMRFLVLSIAVALSAFVTSAVGILGFIGLVAPTLARLCGARRPSQLIFWSPLIGAGLLLFSDAALQLASKEIGDFLPTGAVTALFGSPLLLFLLPRLKVYNRLQTTSIPRYRLPRMGATQVVILGIGLFVIVTLSIFLGRDSNAAWTFVTGPAAPDILAIRIPKVIAALSSGAMLAVAGAILQRLTANDMASPEVLGISAGATFGIAFALLIAETDPVTRLILAAAGAFCVLASIVLTSRSRTFDPGRVLLAGIALSAMVDAIVGVMSSSGDPRAAILMRWMSGSTYLVDSAAAELVAAAAVLLTVFAFLCSRWLDILTLGPSPAAAVGIPLARSRLFLFGLAGVMTAAATLTVGPLTFVGLMGSHLAREFGLRRALPQMTGAAIIGGALMVIADFLGRTIVSPYQIPAGLVAALVGAPFLMMMLARR